MKIETGKTYVNKATKRKVVVNSIENGKVIISEIGRPGQVTSRSIRDFAIKYQPAKEIRKKR